MTSLLDFIAPPNGGTEEVAAEAKKPREMKKKLVTTKESENAAQKNDLVALEISMLCTNVEKRKEEPAVNQNERSRRREEEYLYERVRIQKESFKKVRALVREMINHKDAGPFNSSLDPNSAKASRYLEIVKKPMNLVNVKAKIDSKEITTIGDIAKLIRRTFNNAMLYYPPENPTNANAKRLLEMFERRMNTIFEDYRKNINHNDRVHSFKSGLHDDELPFSPLYIDFLGTNKKRKKVNESETIETVQQRIQEIKEELQTFQNVNSPSHLTFETQFTPETFTPDKCFPMTAQERQSLAEGISILHSNELVRVARIVLLFTPQLRKIHVPGCSIEIDLEALEPTTLRALESFVDSISAERKERQKVSKSSRRSAKKRRRSEQLITPMILQEESGSSYED